MDDLISRQDAINEFSYCQTYLFDSIDRDPKISLEDAKYAIEQLPSAQKKGHWVQNDNGTWSCSNCQSWIPNEQHYYARFCLYCGADMRGDEDG